MNTGQHDSDILREAAFHEAGHAVIARCLGFTLLKISIYEVPAGHLRGETCVDSQRHVPLILAASKACLKAFQIAPADTRDLADDHFKLKSALSETPPRDVDVDDDKWLAREVKNIRRRADTLFRRADIRAAVQALAEHLMRERSVDGVLAQELIAQHLQGHNAARAL